MGKRMVKESFPKKTAKKIVRKRVKPRVSENVTIPGRSATLPVITHLLGWLFSFVGPLIILLASDDEYVKNHARLSLNWQLSLILYGVISAILMMVLIGFVFLLALSLMNIVFSIVAAIKAGDGKLWHYPLTIKFFDVEV